MGSYFKKEPTDWLKKDFIQFVMCVPSLQRPWDPSFWIEKILVTPFFKTKVFAVASEHEHTTEVGAQAQKHEFVI